MKKEYRDEHGKVVRTETVPKYTLDQIIEKMESVIGYLVDWYMKMKTIIQHKPGIYVTDVYVQCLKQNPMTLKHIKTLMIFDPTLILDPHVLCTNRVEGLFGYMRFFSNIFDSYQFMIRLEYVTYELLKGLRMKLPYHNRLSRSYILNESIRSSSVDLEQLASRKAHTREIIPAENLEKLKDRLLRYYCIKHKTIRNKFYNNKSDAEQCIAAQSTLPVDIPEYLQPIEIPPVTEPSFQFEETLPQIITQMVYRTEKISIVSGSQLKGTIQKSTKSIVRLHVLLFCTK